MNDLTINVLEVAHHRNGITGASFNVVKFDMKEDAENRRMVGIVFKEADHVAVLDLDLLTDGDIKTAWRGDHFASELRKAIDEERKKPWKP